MVPKIFKEGFTVLSEGGERPIADIVIVHGLGGGPVKTWTAVKEDSNTINFSSKRKKHGVRLFHSPAKSEFTRVESAVEQDELESTENTPEKNTKLLYWPLDLLKHDFEDVRILIYGYDARVVGFWTDPVNRDTIIHHGANFLRDLVYQRKDDPERPLIFIAHSLGGLVIKEAFRRSRGGDSSLKSIVSSTQGVIFFGTPHRGSKFAQTLEPYRKNGAAWLTSTSPNLLNDLSSDSAWVEMWVDDFGQVLEAYQNLQICTFEESKSYSAAPSLKLPLLNLLSRRVVDPMSSTIGHGREEKYTINKNHEQMVKFTSKDDRGYRTLKNVLHKYVDQIHERGLQNRQTIQTSLRNEILCSLRKSIPKESLVPIDDPTPYTFNWIFSNSEIGFTNWLTSDSNLFWIKGKPGSGKSTLMTYVWDHENTHEILRERWKSNITTTSYFFRDQISSNNKSSYEGLLRTIICDSIIAVGDLIPFIQATSNYAQLKDRWSRSDLEQAIISIGSQTKVSGCICVFVDALDEYIEGHTKIARNLLDLLASASRGSFKVKICASSRPMNEFKTMFSGVSGFSIHEHTREDIKTLVNSRIAEAQRGKMELLCELIASEAKGIFRWVTLVLDHLSDFLYNHESEDELLMRLRELPNDLETFYEHLLLKIPTTLRRGTLNILTLMFCNANRGTVLTLAEISLALALPEEDFMECGLRILPLDDLERCETLKRRMDTWLSSFIDVVKEDNRGWSPPAWTYRPLTEDQYRWTTANIQFSHKTAKDFISKIMKMNSYKSEIGLPSIYEGHEQLCRLYTYLARSKSGVSYLLTTFSKDETDEATGFDIFDTELFTYFGLHARELEFIQHTKQTGQIVISHNSRDTDEQAPVFFKGPSIYSLYPRTQGLHNHRKFDDSRVKRMETFFNTLSTFLSSSWLEEYADRNLLPVPQSTLAFSILSGLFLYAMDIIDSKSTSLSQTKNPSLLFWTLASCEFLRSNALFPPWRDESQRIYMFADYLIERGADVNERVTIPFERRSPELDKSLESAYADLVASEDEQPCAVQNISSQSEMKMSGTAQVSLLNYAIGIITRENFPSELSFTAVELIGILVEAGADCTENNMENYWQLRNEPRSRSALHYLTFPLASTKTDARGNTTTFDPFQLPDEGPLLIRTIKTLLDHGADPNAIDSDGWDVFTCIMMSCPRNVVEYALEKGAKVSVRCLWGKGGSPPRRLEGLLWEGRWLKKRYYNPDAWEMVERSGILASHKEEENSIRDKAEEEEAEYFETESSAREVISGLNSIWTLAGLIKSSFISR